MFDWVLNTSWKFHQTDNILVENSSTLELPDFKAATFVFVELTKLDVLTWIAS